MVSKGIKLGKAARNFREIPMFNSGEEGLVQALSE